MPTRDTNELTVFEQDYQSSLARNAQAWARLYQLLTDQSSATQLKVPQQRPAPSQHLSTHLESLRLQREYTGYEVVSTYLRNAQQIAEEDGIHEAPTSGTVSQFPPPRNDLNEWKQAQQRLNELIVRSNSLVENLELALVEARRHLKLERALLDRAKAQHTKLTHHTVKDAGPKAKLRALEAVRTELQTWIADNLAKCEPEPNDTSYFSTPLGHEVSADEQPQLDAEVEAEYEKYIEARKKLSCAAEALRRPLAPPSTDYVSKAESVVSPSKGFAKYASNRGFGAIQEGTQRTYTSSTAEGPQGPYLAEVENSLLPQYQHEKALEAYACHLEEQTRQHNERLVQVLNLLSHESHLLPVYPRPGRTEDVHHVTDQNREVTEIDRLLQAWDFASRSADAKLREVVEGNVVSAEAALGDAGERIQEMHVLEGMKKRVLSKN